MENSEVLNSSAALPSMQISHTGVEMRYRGIPGAPGRDGRRPPRLRRRERGSGAPSPRVIGGGLELEEVGVEPVFVHERLVGALLDDLS